MHPGGCPTQAAGHTRDQILSMTGAYIDVDTLRIRATLMGHARDKYFAPFVNGQYVGYNVYAPIDQPLEFLAKFTNGTTLGSFYLEDAGDYATFGSTVPTGQAQNFDTITSNRLYLEWTGSYSITSVTGDTQLASITITGAKRSVNVGSVQGWLTRGMLTYSITSVGTTKVVRFWTPDLKTMVAEGSRVGNGAVTCSAANNSGLSVTATLTYSADVVPNTAYIELRWPKSYQIHYSTSPLVFPRSPEATVNDQGSDNYLFLTPVLSSGTYNCNVLEVDDGGVVQTSSIPTTISKTLNSVPLPPTIAGASGTAASTTINWTNGQSGCTYTVYYSHPNMPINFLASGSPTPITTALNATSATLAAITGYAAVDTTTALATLKSSFDSAVSTCNTAFSSGESGFAAAVTTLVASLKSAMDTFSNTIWLRMTPWKKQLDTSVATLTNQLAVFSGLLSTSDWQTQIGQYYARLLATIGDMLEHNPGRYMLPNAAVGAGAAGSAAVGTGGMPSDGTSALSLSMTRYSLSDAAKPTVRPGVINVVVRATAAGIEEKNDQPLSIEYTNAGAIYNPRPNTAAITSISATSGLTLAVTGQTVNDDAGGAATILDFYAQTTIPVDLTNPQASASLTDDGTGVLSASVNYTLPGNGWYYLAVAARTAAGARSLTATERLLEFDNTGPGAVTGLTVKVVRGRGNRIG